MPKPKSCRQSSLPSFRSKQRVRSDFFSRSSASEVTNTRFPYTTGELVPHPGSLTDQQTFTSVVHRTGRFLPSATLLALGPLQQGQSSQSAVDDKMTAQVTRANRPLPVGFTLPPFSGFDSAAINQRTTREDALPARPSVEHPVDLLLTAFYAVIRWNPTVIPRTTWPIPTDHS